jgi:hypothetical protein
MAAQTVKTTAFDKNFAPGDQVTISGADLDKVTAVALRPDGKSDDKSDLKADISAREAGKVTFSVPASASGKYNVIVTPPGNTSIPLTVASAPPSSAGASPTPLPAPVIRSVFPTTTFPTNDRFDFEIIGDNFDSHRENDVVEVDGQGPIEVSPPADCAKQVGDKYTCMEVDSDGHRIKVLGYKRKDQYRQGGLKVRVIVKGSNGKEAASAYSDAFTLARVSSRIILFLALAFFALLMYVIYRLVSKGIQGFTVAGQKYGPLAAFLIDNTTDSYSLSKFQLFALSMVAFFGYVYVFLCQVLVQWKFAFPDIPDNYPSLLAISAGTAVAAVGVNSTRGTKGAGPVYPSAADFISNGGLVVPERFQFFVWTLIACIGFIVLILLQDPATVSGFPNFPTGLLYVMGVSAGGYLGGKAVRGAGPIIKQVQVSATSADLNVVLQGENLDKNGKFRIDGASQALVGAITGDPQPQSAQGYYSKLVFVLSQAAGFAQGDHTFEITNADGVGAQAIFTATPMKITNTPTLARGTTGPVTLTVNNYREGSTARWLAPFASSPVEIAAADVKRTATAVAGDTVTVNVPAGDKPGTGTLTLVSPLGGTEAVAVTVS